MQNFTYHSHNNSQGIFDGRSSAEEMIAKAEELGFEAIGVSNHLCVHPSMPNGASKMFFNDPRLAVEVYKKVYAELDEVAARHKIKVLKGFEVDFFPSIAWRKWFEEIIRCLDYDYLIGASHFICNADESYMCNIYHLERLPEQITPEDKNELLCGYWKNVTGAAASGYFDFIAHLDYCTQFGLCTDPKWQETKQKLIDTISRRKQAFEINTGGIERIGRPYPDWWICQELIKNNVPVVISCDSHHTSQIGRHFAEAEDFLHRCKCKHRFKIMK